MSYWISKCRRDYFGIGSRAFARRRDADLRNGNTHYFLFMTICVSKQLYVYSHFMIYILQYIFLHMSELLFKKKRRQIYILRYIEYKNGFVILFYAIVHGVLAAFKRVKVWKINRKKTFMTLVMDKKLRRNSLYT